MRTAILSFVLLLGAGFAGDKVELLSGATYEGKLLEDKGDEIRFEVHISGSKAEISIPKSKIHALTVNRKKTILNEKAAKKKKPKKKRKSTRKPKSTAKSGDAPTRSKTEVVDFIKSQGRIPPTWYKNTPLRYPQSLDLSWPKPPQGSPWNASKNVGQFIWSTINENQSRWKEGVKFLHHMLGVNKGKPNTLDKTMDALGTMYHNLHEDWARAAFWWQRVKNLNPRQKVGLAHCYYKLGSKPMAVDLLNTLGSGPNEARLWSEMGETDKALQVSGGGSGGNLAAGDACRAAGRYPEALSYYQKVANDSSQRAQRDRNRAQASITAIKLVENLDMRRVRPGKYREKSLGYAGDVEVEVVVSGGKIASVNIINHKEKQYYSSLKDTPPQIIEKQGVKGVDTTSRATITSEAILNATVKALGKGMK